MPNLSAPKNISWLIAIALGVIGALVYLFGSVAMDATGFWLLFAGFALLAVATLIDGL